jgi:hypothetical protein
MGQNLNEKLRMETNDFKAVFRAFGARRGINVSSGLNKPVFKAKRGV